MFAMRSVQFRITEVTLQSLYKRVGCDWQIAPVIENFDLVSKYHIIYEWRNGIGTEWNVKHSFLNASFISNALAANDVYGALLLALWYCGHYDCAPDTYKYRVFRANDSPQIRGLLTEMLGIIWHQLHFTGCQS